MTPEPTGDPRKAGASRLRKVAPILTLGLICIVAAVLVYAHPWQGDASESDIEWSLTLVGSSGENVTLSLKDIKAMESAMSQGGFFTTTGVVHGPYDVKGVRIEDLCDLVGGLGPSDGVLVSAVDGYSAFFEHDEIGGNISTYEYSAAAGDLKEVPHENLWLTLMYEQDGKALSDDDGKPLRLAVAGDDRLLTEGFRWVRWVDRIEVITSG
jgi:DMSO/TMAO reductase YedYZ molybdopterin-dependent catalytic subunit